MDCSDQTNVNCPCKKFKCERHGDCIACREHHSRPDIKYQTACDRLNKNKKKKQSDKQSNQ